MDAVLLGVHGGVSMSAENALRLMLSRVGHRAARNLRRHAQPARVPPVEQARQRIPFQIELLQPEIGERPKQIVEANVIDDKAIELVTVDRDVTQACVFPRVFLKHSDADQV